MFKTSIRTENDVEAPVRMFLDTDRSTLLRRGERMPGRIRGEFPKVFAADVENAALFRYRLSLVLARIRSVTSPSTRKGCPGTTLGRAVPPYRKIVPVVFWLIPIGKPLWIVVTGVNDQPPRSMSPI